MKTLSKNSFIITMCCISIMLIYTLIFITDKQYKELENKLDGLQQEVDSLKSYYDNIVVINNKLLDKDDWSQRLSE